MRKIKEFLTVFTLIGFGFILGILTVGNNRIQAKISVVSLSTPTYNIKNCITIFDTENVQTNASGYAFWFVKQGFAQDGVDLKMSYVDKAQATHPPHQHDNEEIFYVLEGQVIVHLNEEEIELGPHSSLYCPKGSYHGIRRAGDQPARYLVINNHGISRKQQ